MELTIDKSCHPCHTDELQDYCKWRLAYDTGCKFINKYFYKLSKREDDDDFKDRKNLAYIPAFAAAAINDIKNSIYQRTADVARKGGPDTYQKASAGLLGGVDLDASSMNTYIGSKILTELLVIRRVGVLVDNPRELGSTMLEKGNKHPYLNMYCAENIRNWRYEEGTGEKILKSVLLEDRVHNYDEYEMPCGYVSRYRLMKRTSQGVEVTIYDDQSKEVEKITLQLDRIPFVMFEIAQSLMKNVADYQIALMNMESYDIAYARKSNYPIFYEFFDPTTEPKYGKQPGIQGDTGAKSKQEKGKTREIAVGLAKGRRYPEGMSPPGFVNPNPDTLRVSMEKGKQLKDDIRLLVNLNLSNIHPTRSSAESKQEDQLGLESALSYIGLLLEKGENEIAYHWAAFEGEKSTRAEISYPKNYSLKSEAERLEEAEKLGDLQNKVPSDKFRRVVAKRIANLTVGQHVRYDELQAIYKEIDQAPTLTCHPDEIIADHTAGLVSDKTASVARGYKEGEVEQARKDRAERIKLTMEAQGGPQGDGAARGAPELGGKTGADEKAGKPQRGTADKVIKE